jgi:hypothetical protein
MNDPHVSEANPAGASSEELRSALFAQMVMQQSSMAMVLLGKAAHPETGKVVRDLEAAKLFIDQLEMLEFKTQGNLNPEEAALLKQSLMSLRMAFVEAVDSPPAGAESAPDQGSPPAGSVRSPEPAKAEAAPAGTPTEEEHRKKFTKKY